MNKHEIDFIERHKEKLKGRVLDVGSCLYETSHFDKRSLFTEYLGIDMAEGPNVDAVVDITDPSSVLPVGVDSVLCNSVLEHVDKPWKAGEFIENNLPSGGCLYVSVPFVWRVHGYPDDYWRFTFSGLSQIFPNVEWEEQLYSFKDHNGFYKKIYSKFKGDGMLPITLLHAIGHRR